MFTTEELDAYLTQLGIPSGGRRLVERARRESPVRDVQSRRGNVITHYQSEKMGGRRIEVESLNCELPAVVCYEHDRDLIEYYAQPTRIDLKVSNDGASGRSFRLIHIPDFLLLTKAGVIIEEWRDEGRLIAIAQKSPGRIHKDEQGRWRSPHMEAHLGSLGIEYRLRSANEHPRTFVQNLTFLSDYLSANAPPLEERAREAIRSCFQARAYMTIGELIACGAPNASDLGIAATSSDTVSFTPDDVYTAIAKEHVAFDLENDLLSDTHRSPVYRDGEVLAFTRTVESAPDLPRSGPVSIEVGTQILYDGRPYVVQLLGQDHVTLQSDNGVSEMALSTLLSLHSRGRTSIIPASSSVPEADAMETLHALTPDEVKRANLRAELLRQAQSNPNAVTVSRRTLQRWCKAIRDAGNIATRNLALVGNTRKQGNRLRKLSPDVIAMIHTVIKGYYNTPTAVTKRGAYIEFTKRCQAEELVPCSYKAFCTELKNHSSVRKREGKRRAYQEGPIVWYLYAQEPIHGVRPFQYVHIDHTQVEIDLRSPHFPGSLGKPWLTLALDAESRDVVGFYLSFDEPSYRSCMMVLRDIVRRHGRLPEVFVLDNGPDLRSGNFKAVCKLHNVDIRWRPAAQPRHGSVVERAFGTTMTQLIHNMEGNTKLMRHVRSVTKSVRPEQFATWTLPALSGALDYYFRQLYGSEPHPAHHEAPAEHLKRRLVETGIRTQRLISLSRDFLIGTCPAVDRKGTRCVDGQRGVKISHMWYWTDAFRGGWDGREVTVRVDPWDARVCYVQLNNNWHQCISKLVTSLRTLTRVELESYFEEMSTRGGVKKKDLTPERIAEWAKVLDATAFDARLRITQDEQRAAWNCLGLTAVDSDVQMAASATEPAPTDSHGMPPENDLTVHLDSEEQEPTQTQEVEYDLY